MPRAAKTHATKALLQIKVEPELHKALKHHAIEIDQDMSEIGARLIEQYLREHNALPGQAPQSDRLAQSA